MLKGVSGTENAVESASQRTLPRMRSMREAIAELHEADPGCKFTLYALRVAAKSGKVSCVRCGRKILVNMDALYTYLEGEKAEPPDEGLRSAFVRRAGAR